MSLKGRSIAVITLRFPNLVQPYVLNHLVWLKKAGARLTIVSGEPGRKELPLPGVAAYGLEEHIRFIRLHVHPHRLRRLVKQFASCCLLDYHPGRVARSALRLIAARGRRRQGLGALVGELASLKLMSDGPFDLAHSHYLGGTYEYLFLKEVFGVPLVTTFHGLPSMYPTKAAADKMARVFEAGDLFLVNTRFARGQLEDLGCSGSKIAILSQGCDLGRFSFRDRAAPVGGRFVVLSVARLSPEKGLKYAIRAIKLLSARHPEIEYQIVGGGQERGALEKEIAALGAWANVKLLGTIGSEELLRRYHEAHAFLLPSIRARDGGHEETQGVVIQEAQATGLPVIATRTGGIPECVIDGQTGLLVEERDPQALAGAIESFIADYEMARRLAREGRRLVETIFDQERISERLFGLYEALLA